MSGPRFLYLHGFGSGPDSFKGRALSERWAARGVALERVSLRLPSLEHLRFSAMIDEVRARIGGAEERAVIVGSSLGGLTAARVAEIDPRACALVLLAPALRMIERWRARLGEATWRAYESSGWLAITDYAEKREARVDYGFAEDCARIDARNGGWPDVRVPTLIVHGTRDDVVGVDLSRTWSRGKRHVRLVEVDDGHELTSSLDVIAEETERFLAPFGV